MTPKLHPPGISVCPHRVRGHAPVATTAAPSEDRWTGRAAHYCEVAVSGVAAAGAAVGAAAEATLNP